MIDFSSLNKLRLELGTAITSSDIDQIHSILGSPTTITTTTTATTSSTSPPKSTSYLVNLNYLDKDGQTPLHLACLLGNLSICKILVEAGASQSIKNKDGWFPIHIASYLGHIDIVMFLLDERNFNKEATIDVYDDATAPKLSSTSFLVQTHRYRATTTRRRSTTVEAGSDADEEDEDDDEISSGEEDEESEEDDDNKNESEDEENQEHSQTLEILKINENEEALSSSSSTAALGCLKLKEEDFSLIDIFDLKNLDLSSRDFLF
jgi:hypothetical protein